MKSSLKFNRIIALGVLFISITLLSSCSKKEQIIGQWFNPVSGEGVAEGTELHVFYYKNDSVPSNQTVGTSQTIQTVKDGFFSFEKPKSNKGFVTITPSKLSNDLITIPTQDTTIAVTDLSEKIELHVYRRKKGRIIFKGIENYNNDSYELNLTYTHDVFGYQGGDYRIDYSGSYVDLEQSLINFPEGKNTISGTFQLNGQTTSINKEVNWIIVPGASDSILIYL